MAIVNTYPEDYTILYDLYLCAKPLYNLAEVIPILEKHIHTVLLKISMPILFSVYGVESINDLLHSSQYVEESVEESDITQLLSIVNALADWYALLSLLGKPLVMSSKGSILRAFNWLKSAPKWSPFPYLWIWLLAMVLLSCIAMMWRLYDALFFL